MAQDIFDGHIPGGDGPIDYDEIHNRLYRDHPLFANFPYDRTRFKARLDPLRQIVGKLKRWSDFDADALAQDRTKHPAPNQDIHGEPRWDGSEAQRLLKLDIDHGNHVGKKPREIHASKEEYKAFGLTKFRKHLDQEIESRKPRKGGKRQYKKNNYGDKNLSRRAPPDEEEDS